MATDPLPRGRPRSFDRDTALERAMALFWSRGYDGVSLDDLLKAMGKISPPSFYAAFGSKDALFQEVLQRYMERVGNRIRQALEVSPVRAGVEGMLTTAVDAFLSNEAAPGCLVSLAATNCTRTNKQAHDQMRSMRCEGGEMIRRRLVRAVNEGDLPPRLPLAEIAGFYATFVQGLSLQARDGASRSDMLSAVRCAMAAWPALTAPRRTAARAASGTARRVRRAGPVAGRWRPR